MTWGGAGSCVRFVRGGTGPASRARPGRSNIWPGGDAGGRAACSSPCQVPTAKVLVLGLLTWPYHYQDSGLQEGSAG